VRVELVHRSICRHVDISLRLLLIFSYTVRATHE